MDTIWLTKIKGKQVCDPYANWLMSSNKLIYIFEIFCDDELYVSKDCGSLTKIKGSQKEKLVILSC
jgi:hypothetical protein